MNEFSLFTLTGYDTLDHLFEQAESSITNADRFIYPIEQSDARVFHNNCPRPGDFFNNFVVCFVAHTAQKTSLIMLDSSFYEINQDDIYVFCPQVIENRIGVVRRGAEIMTLLPWQGTGPKVGYVGTGPAETVKILWRDLKSTDRQPKANGALSRLIESEALGNLNFSISAAGLRRLVSSEAQQRD